jgi:hypothetical protein
LNKTPKNNYEFGTGEIKKGFFSDKPPAFGRIFGLLSLLVGRKAIATVN